MNNRNELATKTAAVEQTRQDIAATVAALQTRLQPQNVLHDARAAVLEGARATASDATNALTQLVREVGAQIQQTLHDAPVAASILGAIASWLTTLDQHTAASAAAITGTSHALGNAAAAQVSALTAQLHSQMDAIAAEGRQAAGTLGHQAQQQIDQSLRQIEHSLGEHPWLAGSLAVALGLTIGLVLPKTPTEHALIEQAKARVASTAHDAATIMRATAAGIQHVAQSPNVADAPSTSA
jgi:ElaB/YqjD/DUF883 family membrane-anchored ribosome-binding protein